MSRLVRLVLAQSFKPRTNGSAVANEQGSYTTPSFVSFTQDERLIGEAAKNQAAMNPANTIFDIKFASLESSQSEKSQLTTAIGD